MAQAIYELLWIRMMLFELRMKLEGPMKLYCDNKLAISIFHNLIYHDQTNTHGDILTFHQGKTRKRRDSYFLCCFKESTCRFSHRKVAKFYISIYSRQVQNGKYFRASSRSVEHMQVTISPHVENMQADVYEQNLNFST